MHVIIKSGASAAQLRRKLHAIRKYKAATRRIQDLRCGQAADGQVVLFRKSNSPWSKISALFRPALTGTVMHGDKAYHSAWENIHRQLLQHIDTSKRRLMHNEQAALWDGKKLQQSPNPDSHAPGAAHRQATSIKLSDCPKEKLRRLLQTAWDEYCIAHGQKGYGVCGFTIDGERLSEVVIKRPGKIQYIDAINPDSRMLLEVLHAICQRELETELLAARMKFVQPG